jgi:DNA-binding PadR family transcriptional regulator
VPINSTSAVILGLLHDGEATGGEIVASAEQRLAAQGGVTRSQVYRELPTLVDAGLIEADAAPSGARRRTSQAYAITAAGRVAFAAWAQAPIGGDLVRSATVLRLGFGAHLTAAQRVQIIEAARAEHEVAFSEHVQCAKALRASGDGFAASAAEFAVEYERAFLAWLDSVPVD